MPKTDLDGVAAALRSGESFLISSHISPDGDAIGSMLALKELLRAMGKSPLTCAIDGPVPQAYRWLPGASDIVETPGRVSSSHDTAVIVDVGRRDRLGAAADLIGPSSQVIVLDHHLEDAAEGDVVFVDPSYASVGEIITELFDVVGVAMPREAAECAYVAVATDTGGFRFSNTSPRTHRIAARLIAAGLDVAELSARMFERMSAPKFRLLRRVLDRLEILEDGRLAFSYLTLSDMRECGAAGEDVEGLVNFPRNIEGVEVGMLFREVGEATVKVSMRSQRGFNCAELLRGFGGGGHAPAAGATLARPLREAMTQVTSRVRAALGAGS